MHIDYNLGTHPFSEPGILHHKWIEPRHMHYQISRWKGHGRESHLSHDQEIENAFFNGSGMTVWENIFGTYNPWTAEVRSVVITCRVTYTSGRKASDPTVILASRSYVAEATSIHMRTPTLAAFGTTTVAPGHAIITRNSS